MTQMIEAMLDLETCFKHIREIRWADGVCCPRCSNKAISPHGFTTGNVHQRRYKCKSCKISFNDLTNTVMANSRLPICLWLGVYEAIQQNKTQEEIAEQFNLDIKDSRDLIWQLRHGIELQNPYQADW